MTLQVSGYDVESDAIYLSTGEPHDETNGILNWPGLVLDYDEATYKPTAFELFLSVSGYIPLSPERGYNPETDTLTFGDGDAKVELVVANGDLVAHWGYDEDDSEPEYYTPVAVELRNASKHLAEAITKIAKISK